jgi:hypothetical protein
MTPSPSSNKDLFWKGLAVLLIGSAVNHFGDRLLGVKIELWYGLHTFNGMWIVDMFVLPFFVGFLVAVMFGMGGKWLCYFPPLIVRATSYFEISHSGNLPEGASVLPLGWWGFFVILVIEAAAFGGIMGEIMVKGTYGRSPRHKIYKERPNQNDSDPET